MYKLNLTKKQLGEIIVLLLFDKVFNPEFIQESELFNELREMIDQKKLNKSSLFQMYFDIDSSLRSRYKQFSKNIEEKDASIFIRKDNQQNEEYEEQLIIETVKKVTGKEHPNEEKVRQLIDELLY